MTEQYLSVTVSKTTPRRLIASVAAPSVNLWSVPISDRILTDMDVRRYPLPNTRAHSPSVARDFVLFLSEDGRHGLSKLEKGVVVSLWSGRDGGVVAPPAISRSGRQICFSVREQGRSHLYLMSADGTNVRRLLAGELDVRGAASWSPKGDWVAVAANDGRVTSIYKIPVNGGPPVRLTDTASYNPLWSPDGEFIVYSEPVQGSTLVTKAITPDKRPFRIPEIQVVYLVSTPYRFAPDGEWLIFLEGVVEGARNFYKVNLKTGQALPLTDLATGLRTRSFDVTPGGEIIFDRLRENSDLVLIDLPR
jgi:tricorn protease-like protein